MLISRPGASRALDLHFAICAPDLKPIFSLSILFAKVLILYSLEASRALELDFPIWAPCPKPIFSLSILFIKVLISRPGASQNYKSNIRWQGSSPTSRPIMKRGGRRPPLKTTRVTSDDKGASSPVDERRRACRRLQKDWFYLFYWFSSAKPMIFMKSIGFAKKN